MTDMKAVSSGAVDAIYSSHNIEHLYPHEVDVALTEFSRVLNSDGFVFITCPDLQSVAKLIAEDKLLETAYISPSGPISPIDILYGYRPSIAKGNFYMCHRTGFTLKTLTKTLKNSGFNSVVGGRREAAFDLFCLAFKKKLTEKELLEMAEIYFP